MKEQRQEIKFFKPDGVAEWELIRSIERCLTEAAVASAFEKMLSEIIKTVVTEAFPALSKKVWINRFNTHSQTNFFIQEDNAVIANCDLATSTIEFSHNTPLAHFLSDFFKKIGWTIKGIFESKTILQ